MGNLRARADPCSDLPSQNHRCSHRPSTLTPSRTGSRSLSPRSGATRLGDEVFSTSPPPCKTSTESTVSSSVRGKRVQRATYINHFLRFAIGVRFQNLYCNIPTTVFPLPNVRVPAPAHRFACSIITNGDLQGSRNNFVGTADPVQRSDAFPPGL